MADSNPTTIENIAVVDLDIARMKAEYKALRETCIDTAAETSLLKKEGALLDKAINRAERKKSNVEIYISALLQEVAKYEKIIEALGMLLQEQKMNQKPSEHRLIESAVPKRILPDNCLLSSNYICSTAGSNTSDQNLT